MRVKFPEMPEKFMESELELNEELQTLHVIATMPELYPILMEVTILCHVTVTCLSCVYHSVSTYLSCGSHVSVM